MSKWNKDCDAKLLFLLDKRLPRGIDPGNLNKAYCERVIYKFFPRRTYNNFNQLYCKKVRAYNINRTLSGGRKAIVEETRELVLTFKL